MNLTEKKINEINEEYLAIRGPKYLTEVDKVGVHKLKVADGFDTSIFAGNWQICNIDHLNSMIKELTDMKQAIENVTGIR